MSESTMRPPLLIILGGLPASGKTTIARALGSRLGATHVRVDTIEQAIRDAGEEVGIAGYTVAYGIAGDNLSLGLSVVADSVNALEITRNAWLSVATRNGATPFEIHVTCSDPAEHRLRAETRQTDVPGLVKPDWQKTSTRHFEDWGDRPFRIDTAAKKPEDLVEEILAAIAARLR